MKHIGQIFQHFVESFLQKRDLTGRYALEAVVAMAAMVFLIVLTAYQIISQPDYFPIGNAIPLMLFGVTIAVTGLFYQLLTGNREAPRARAFLVLFYLGVALVFGSLFCKLLSLWLGLHH